MTSPGPSSRIQSGAVAPLHPRAGGAAAESSTVWQEDGKQSHRLPMPPVTVSNSSPFPTPTSPPTVSSLPRSPGRGENPTSPGSRWKKGKLIGRGTFGHVYVGVNSESGEVCAMKEVTLFSDDAKSKESAKQLGQEIGLLSRLRHQNIVHYYGSETVDDKLYICLEFVSGGSIYKLLQEYGQFGELTIRSYTRQILSGLAYLHANNTVHRDIKGANILVDPNGCAKLADFGMAKHITGESCPLSFKGSPYWMAPEVINNSNGCCNLAVDIWSLGCTVLEMATTKPPWSLFEGVAAIFKIGNSKDLPAIPDHLSDEGKDFVRQCLQRNPLHRPTAAQLLEHAFVKNAAPLKRPILASESTEIPPGVSDGARSPGVGHVRNLSSLEMEGPAIYQSEGAKGGLASRTEGELLELITQTDSIEWTKNYPLMNADNLIGVEFHVKYMLSLLNLHAMDVRCVGICGMNGIDRTTIAKAVYNRIFSTFDGSSFLVIVNAQTGIPLDLVSLQRQLFLDILNMEVEIKNIRTGSKLIGLRLQTEKVLIVLDDVGDDMQIRALVGSTNWFGAGSRIIITTKDENILHRCEIDEIYRPEILNEYQSLMLGTPLYQQSISEVERALQKIKEPYDDKIKMVNLILQESGKEIFNENPQKPRSWDNEKVVQRSISEVERSLQKIRGASDDDLQIINLVLEDRGRQIVLNENPEEPMQHIRSWDEEKVEDSYLYIDLFVGKHFKDLRILDLSNCSILVKMPDISSLQCLERLILQGCCELVDVHESIGMNVRLIYLDLKSCSKLMQLPRTICQLGALEILFLSNCGSIKRLPDSTSHLVSLDELSLDSTKISELPDDVGLLVKLVKLDVSGCTNLVKLPRSMGRMSRLRHINMSRTSIVELPDDFLMLSSLEILEMAKCTKLKGFPRNKQCISGPSCLSHLKVLDLEHCKRLESLPELPSSLLQLNVMGCRLLQVIDLYSLNNLMVFSFGGCDKMVDIPYGIGKLSSLEKLVFCLINADSLLANVLSSLKHLALLDCRKLKSLPGLPSSLINLHLIGCVLLETLPNLSSLKNLKELNLTGCIKLKEIQGLDELKSLTSYDVTLCHCFTDTPLKVQGQGTLKDEYFEYEFDGDIIHTNFVIGEVEIDQGLVLCLAFSSCHITIDSYFHGVSDDCILQFEASISRGGRQIHCMNDLVININLPGEDVTFIYIHYFQGCNWFGFPLLHGDVIEELRILNFTGEWNLKFFHLSVENMPQTRSQKRSVENAKDFFNWTEIDSEALHYHPTAVEDEESEYAADVGQETKLLPIHSRMRQYCKLRLLH